MERSSDNIKLYYHDQQTLLPQSVGPMVSRMHAKTAHFVFALHLALHSVRSPIHLAETLTLSSSSWSLLSARSRLELAGDCSVVQLSNLQLHP